MTHPRVSVICPFYNAERFLAEAVESVLSQDYRDSELLLVDDGSNDGSTSIAMHFAQRFPERVRYLEHPSHANRGAAASRNLGVAASGAPLLAFIDSDDVWRPGKLSEQIAILEDRADAGMVCGSVNYWRSWEGGADMVIAADELTGTTSYPPSTALRLFPLGPGPAPCPSELLIRRSVLDAAGGFEPEFVGPGNYEDQAFLVKVYLTAPVYFAPNLWLDYRLHAGSGMATATRQGTHREMRRYFLEWFEAYLAARSFEGRDLVIAALDRVRWELDHPVLGSVLRIGRRLYRRAVRRPKRLS